MSRLRAPIRRAEPVLIERQPFCAIDERRHPKGRSEAEQPALAGLTLVAPDEPLALTTALRAVLPRTRVSYAAVSSAMPRRVITRIGSEDTPRHFRRNPESATSL